MITRDDIALGYWRSLPPYRVDMKAAWQLPEYSATNPPGVTVGKMWRRLNGAHDELFKRAGGKPRWVICRYEDAPDSYQMTNYLMSPTGKPVRIEDVSLEENVKSPRMYTRTPMCKIVTYRPVVRVKMGRRFECSTCKSKGFEVSVLGPMRCTFCDGTESGNPPEEE